jgi:hypothetical protein
MVLPKNVMNLTGRQFGRLVPVEYLGNHRWRCECSCGTRATVHRGNLRSGHTQSCGCLHREVARDGRTTHGGTRSPEYAVWSSMIQRCYRQKTKMYPRYGGRGIRVCGRWRNSFAAFIEDMGKRPSPKHQIDRINNDGNYEPANCRWVTLRDQFNNRSSNVHLIVDGSSRTVAEWSRMTGVDDKLMYCRVKRGWADRDVVMTPVGATREPRTRGAK